MTQNFSNLQMPNPAKSSRFILSKTIRLEAAALLNRSDVFSFSDFLHFWDFPRDFQATTPVNTQVCFCFEIKNFSMYDKEEGRMFSFVFLTRFDWSKPYFLWNATNFITIQIWLISPANGILKYFRVTLSPHCPSWNKEHCQETVLPGDQS